MTILCSHTMKILLVFISSLVVCQITIRVAAMHYVAFGCHEGDNSTLSAAYQPTTLADLLTNLTSKSEYNKFYNFTKGDPPYALYGLFQCPEYLNNYCRQCVGMAAEAIVGLCPSSTEAIVWYEECMLRYANRPILSIYETTPSQMNSSGAVANLAIYPQFPQLTARAVDGLINYIADNASLYDAASENEWKPMGNLYCFAQCTPDLDKTGCEACLRSAFSQVANCCSTRISVMVFLPSCQLKYDNEKFWTGNMALAPPVKQVQEEGPRWKRIVLMGTVASLTIIVIALFIAYRWRSDYKRRRQQPFIQLGGDGRLTPIESVNIESLRFDIDTIKAATRNFSDCNKLGHGGFGVVYKGKLSNGVLIAVKRLTKITEDKTLEFQNEVFVVAKVQHKNLVKLLGFCVTKTELILIFEFLSNLSLDCFLYDPLRRSSLEWEKRFRIIKGIAKGLLYLHEDSCIKVIHRDLKSSNILLDDAMNAKIADFGLAKLLNVDQTIGDTIRIAGTFGYIAPEYAMAGQFSAMSDAYSFGVIVLEIVSGQKQGSSTEQFEGLLSRAWKLWNEESTLKLVDPLLGTNFSEDQAKLCIQIGLLCIQEIATHRPTMRVVLGALEGKPVRLPLPNAPHVYTLSTFPDTSSSGNNDGYYRGPNEGVFSGASNLSEPCPR